jgi:FkbM family methyltransferase
MFSFRYTWEFFRQLLHYPSSIRILPSGAQNVGIYLSSKRMSEWLENPRTVRKTRYGFLIALDQNDKDVVSASIGSSGIYETHISELFRRIVKKGAKVIDVGANLGWYSLLSAKIGAERIIACEPDPRSLELLKRSIAMNGFRGITCYEVCVTAKQGYATLYVAKNKLGANSLVRKPEGEAIQARCTTLDHIVKQENLERIDLIKIDVEGSEPDVVRGASHTLEVTDSILMEWNKKVWLDQMELFRNSFNQHELFQIVKSPKLIRPIKTEILLESNAPDNIYLRRHRS